MAGCFVLAFKIRLISRLFPIGLTIKKKLAPNDSILCVQSQAASL